MHITPPSLNIVLTLPIISEFRCNCSLTLASSRPKPASPERMRGERRDPSHPGALLLQGPVLSLPKGIPPFPPRRGSGFSRNDDCAVSSYDQLHHTACHSR